MISYFDKTVINIQPRVHQRIQGSKNLSGKNQVFKGSTDQYGGQTSIPKLFILCRFINIYHHIIQLQDQNFDKYIARNV